MNICVTTVSNNLDALVDERFGRCPYFLIIDSETMKFRALPNESFHSAHGAGIQAAQNIANSRIEVLITGNVGPNAFGVLSASGIKVITGVSGSARQAVEKFKKGQLTETGNPTVGGHFGIRRGFGRR